MIAVFTGPTLSSEEITRHWDCVCLPPVQHGSVLQLLAEKPVAIGIIDGYFEGAPSVWHKEILYALDQGVAVYGSASMGALRAAELYRFGMVGVGQIFEWYRDGTLTDDDEVAVLHGPQEVGFIGASEPMVNIRATLRLACEQGVITNEQGNTLESRAKLTFYKMRHWNRVLDDSLQLFENPELTERLSSWLKNNRINLKKQDAVEMLKIMHTDSQQVSQTRPFSDHFEWTQVWDDAFRRISGRQIKCSLTNDDTKVLYQLSLDPHQFECYRDKALLFHMIAHNTETTADNTAVVQMLKQFRHQHSLNTHNQLHDYLLKVSLDEPRLEMLLNFSARVEQLKKVAAELKTNIIDQLKLDNRYLHYLALANEKINTVGTQQATFPTDGFRRQMILVWYFETRLGRSVPESLELYLEHTAFDNVQDLLNTIFLDYLYFIKQTPNSDTE